MSLRNPLPKISKLWSSPCLPRYAVAPTTCLCEVRGQNLSSSARTRATVVPPVTQDGTSSRGPTAMVFMNMGGPSTTDEVGDFLSRLFVRDSLSPRNHFRFYVIMLRWLPGRCRPYSSRPPSILSWPLDLPSPHAQNTKTIRCHRWRLSYSKMVGISIIGDVQDS